MLLFDHYKITLKDFYQHGKNTLVAKILKFFALFIIFKILTKLF